MRDRMAALSPLLSAPYLDPKTGLVDKNRWDSERYVEEGLRMDEHPLVVFRDGATGRRPGLTGSRLDVWQVIESVRQNGSVEQAAAYLERPPEQVQACVRYYAANQAEIDDWTERAHAIAERERVSWARQQEIVG